MRTAPLLVGLTLAGCHGTGPAPVPTSEVKSAPKTVAASVTDAKDPESALYDQMRQAAYQIDLSLDSLGNALKAAKELAPKAGGDAKVALLDVSSKLDDAGGSLGDYSEAPKDLAKFKKDFAAEDERRLHCIDDSIDALQKLYDADSVLEDLNQNAPSEHASSLKKIMTDTSEAIDALEAAITAMGGKLPEDDRTEAND